MNASKVSVLFPGQGAYFQGALSNIRESVPAVRSILEEIDVVSSRMLGSRVSEVLVDTTAKSLDELLVEAPDLLQMAIYGTSVAAFSALRARGLRPELLMGHSFGEIAALVCAGAFSISAGAEIVGHRTAALRSAGVVDGRMTALGTGTETAERILGLVGDPDTVVAVENHARQTVISGKRAAVDKVEAVAKALAISARTLKSPYPFHTPALVSASADFAARIRSVPQQALQLEVFSPILMRTYQDSDDLTAALAGHLTRRVRFAEAVRAVHDGGVDVFVESGALDALTTIARRVVGEDGLIFVSGLSRKSTVDSAISQLAEAGMLGLAETGNDALHQAFAPDADPAVFDRFWRVFGARIIDQVRRELGAMAPAAVPAAQQVPELVPVDPVASPAPTPVDPVASTAPTSAAVSRSQLLHDLRAFYADALEYPVEVFEEDTDLEAELGVDSVKQIELLGRVREQYGSLGGLDEVKISERNTLGRIADLVIAA